MKARLSILIPLAALLSGCHTPKYTPKYAVNVKNLTPTVLKDVRIVFPGHTFTVDELITEEKYPAHFLSFPADGPAPRAGTIEFRTPDKAVHSIAFQVPPLKARSDDGAVRCFIKIDSQQHVSVEEWHYDHLFYAKPGQ